MTNNNNNHNPQYPSDSHHTSNIRTNKMMGKKILLTFVISLTLLISLSTVLATQTPKTSQGPTALLQAQNQFQYRYQYECQDCIKTEYVGDKIRLEVREQKRLFNLFDVETVSRYDLNENYEIVQARHNIWAMFLDRNRVREVAN